MSKKFLNIFTIYREMKILQIISYCGTGRIDTFAMIIYEIQHQLTNPKI